MWHNNGGANYGVQLKAPPMESFVEKVRGPARVRACRSTRTCYPRTGVGGASTAAGSLHICPTAMLHCELYTRPRP